MAKQGINTGSAPNDGLGDSLLSGAIKINSNFSEIYTTFGNGTNLVSYVNTAGVATYAPNAGVATYATNAGVATYATTAGVSTISQGLTGTPNLNVGVVTATSFIGDGSKLKGASASPLIPYASNSKTSDSASTLSGISTYTQVGIITGSLATIDDLFGYELVVSDDASTLVVSALGDELTGSTNSSLVYVFDKVGKSYTQVGILTGIYATASYSGEYFGYSLAISGDGKTIAVGAYNDEIGDTAATGIVYVWDKIGVGSDSTFTQVGILTGSLSTTAADRFGNSISMTKDGKTLVVGAREDEPTGAPSNAGLVYVFDRIGNSYNQVGIITGGADSNDWFGTAAEISDDGSTIVVVAEGDELSGSSNSGVIYVFDRIGISSFTRVGLFTGTSFDEGDLFESKVKLSSDGKTIVVGLYNDENPGSGNSSGTVCVFDRVGVGTTSVFNQVGILTGSLSSAANEAFGRSVDVSADGSVIVVGAQDENQVSTSAGLVYVFNRQGNRFNEVCQLLGSNVGFADRFGSSVTISADGKTIFVGAYTDENGSVDSGVVYVFDQQRTTYVHSGITGNIGIATDNPTSKLTVQGDVLVSGVVTATSFRGDGSQLTGISASGGSTASIDLLEVMLFS
jgi:hypothetical protein